VGHESPCKREAKENDRYQMHPEGGAQNIVAGYRLLAADIREDIDH
jgi:hypothetical protein